MRSIFSAVSVAAVSSWCWHCTVVAHACKAAQLVDPLACTRLKLLYHGSMLLLAALQQICIGSSLHSLECLEQSMHCVCCHCGTWSDESLCRVLQVEKV